jgi:two-component system chemotaxis response regulator CheB
MPAHAMARVAVDYCVKADELAALIVRLVRETAPDPKPAVGRPADAPDTAGARARALFGLESGLTCPECSGTLRELREGDVLRFKCPVGHAYTSHTMLEAQGDAIERALWTAVRHLEERALLMRKLANVARERDHEGVAAMFEDRAVALQRECEALREQIEGGRALEPIGHERT